MSQKLDGRRGDLLKFGLGARNWLLAQMNGSGNVLAGRP